MGIYVNQVAAGIEKWTAGPEFTQFLQYADQELPKIVDLLAQAVPLVKNVAVNAAPIGDAFLNAADGALRLVNQLDALQKKANKDSGGALATVDKYTNPTKYLPAITNYSVDKVTSLLGLGSSKPKIDPSIAAAAALQDSAIQEQARLLGTTVPLLEAAQDAQAKVAARTTAAALAQRLANDSYEAANPQIAALAVKYGTTVAALHSARDAQAANAASIAATTLQMQLEGDAAGLLKQSLDTLNGKSLTLAQAQNALDVALTGMTAKTNPAAASLVGMTAASAANRGELITMVQDVLAVAEATGGMSGQTEAGRQKLIDMKQAIIDNAAAHGENRAQVQAFIDTILQIPATVPPIIIDADTSLAQSKINALRVSLGASPALLNTVNGINKRVALLGSAEGNIIKTYSQGGVESHTPQIARVAPGTVRVWAEPETQGEAYIPLANDSRRPRALDIWRQTGSMLGVQNFSVGAVMAPAASSSSSSPSGPRVVILRVDDRDFRGYLEDVADGQVAGTISAVAGLSYDGRVG
jgi:hypothetical protein